MKECDKNINMVIVITNDDAGKPAKIEVNGQDITLLNEEWTKEDKDYVRNIIEGTNAIQG